ncbi:hypothetical protein BDP81DRAFT_61765 [Colletotrichum phormii]|uniref:Uncharacterized protein n=1 Tax=Colletotrichum phormii TaxID=359342 RepID=A0AAI9ZKU7_9PEZI|nr:uncharacterized protein BDP81DRAFT_61765 [Colletotrichum phormii]KAK1633838.1 hypothetical protein BDP81DRAFT_61765 [Colletotrichum phormii]
MASVASFPDPRAGTPASHESRAPTASKACVVGVSNLERPSFTPPDSAPSKKGSGGPENDVLTPSVDLLVRARWTAHAGEAIIPHS